MEEEGGGGMNMNTSLSKLNPGESGIVTRVESPISQRLCELGLTVGTRVECVLRAPLSDPAAYRIRGAVIAIRGRDCGNITVKRL